MAGNKPDATCPGCGVAIAAGTGSCPECRRRYPPSLLKACGDSLEHSLKLVTGDIIHFRGAVIYGDYCTVQAGERFEDVPIFPRGLDIRVAYIVWCADAPNAS